MTEKPVVFVGSSSEKLGVARIIQAQLAEVATVDVWDEAGAFELGSTTLEALVNALDDYDFAVMVMSADDPLDFRGTKLNSARDNILFEIGLFMGKLGRERTFIVFESGANLKVPSDLAGMVIAMFPKPENHADVPAAALEPACAKIRNAIRKRGALARLEKVEARQDVLDSQIRTLQILVKGFVSQYELDKLQGLAQHDPFWVRYHDKMVDELRRLRSIQYLNTQPGYGLTTIREQRSHDPNPFDLKQYVHITDEGREYLRLHDTMRSSSE